MSDKCCNWSITINNPTDDDYKQWESLKGLHWVKEVVGQLEKGEQEQTPHLQGMIKTQSVRFAQLKKALPRAHIEPARNPIALKQYVQKEDTRVASVPTAKVASQQDVQETILMILEQNGYYKTWDHKKEWIDNFNAHRYLIQKDWESLLDTAVRKLILDGYYGIEFVMANPQIRTAFKKYLPEIIYRTWHAGMEAERLSQERTVKASYVTMPEDSE